MRFDSVNYSSQVGHGECLLHMLSWHLQCFQLREKWARVHLPIIMAEFYIQSIAVPYENSMHVHIIPWHSVGGKFKRKKGMHMHARSMDLGVP